MANVNWKILSLLTVALLAALGLQAGAIKIMLNLAHQPDAPMSAAADVRTAPDKAAVPAMATDVAPHRTAAPEERSAGEPVSSAREPKPTVLVSDPPHLADLKPRSDQPRREPSPEARQPATGSPAAAPASSEAALVPVGAMPPPAAAGHAVDPPAPAAVPSAPAGSSAVADSAPEPPAEKVLEELEWLKTRNPKHYTVQIYSGKSMDTLKAIAAATAADEPQAYYSTGSRSGPWYSLVVGDYPDSASAQAASVKLSAQPAGLKPWIRRFDEIQAKIR